MEEQTAAEQIDAIIKQSNDWRGTTMSKLRSLILEADPAIIEEVKWKKPSRPEGVAVWAHDGNVCIADMLKGAVRLTFPKGACIPDPEHLFNTRLNSKTVRAIDFHEGDSIDEPVLKKLIFEGAKVNSSNSN